MQQIVEATKKRHKQLSKDLADVRTELDMEKWRSDRQLDEQEKMLARHYEEFQDAEVARLKLKYDQELKQMNHKLRLGKEENARLKRSKEHVDLKICLFKWRQAGMFTRYIDELNAKFFDKDSLRDLLHQDMQKLFFGQELHLMSNSMKQ